MKIVLATSNKNKIREIKEKVLNRHRIELLTLTDFGGYPDIIENADTFAGNALIKARAVREYTGMIALADDSGLVVDALNGEPGIYSARYGGEKISDIDRYRLLLSKMENIPDEKRTARFVCSIAIVFPDGKEYIAEGTCEGLISRKPSGDNGFGYDPVFYIPEYGMTMAEMPSELKNRISHRAKAIESADIILSGIIDGR